MLVEHFLRITQCNLSLHLNCSDAQENRPHRMTHSIANSIKDEPCNIVDTIVLGPKANTKSISFAQFAYMQIM